MGNEERFKRTKSLNYKCSMVAMVLTQAAIFTFNLSLTANIAAYVVNMIGWMVVGALLEAIAAVHYDVDLTRRKTGR